jgi:hypothetical protein
MEVLVNRLGKFAANAVNFGELALRRPFEPLLATEMFEQLTAALWSEAGQIFELRALADIAAPLSVRRYREAMGLIAHLLQ